MKEPCPVKDCVLPVDIILEARGGERFGAHVTNLQQFSEGFPFADSVNIDDATPPKFEERGEVLSLMLQFMHHARQPDISELRFTTLAALAEAAEKYGIYSAITLAKVYMTMAVETHPLQVLMYALKHDYPELANQAARLTVGHDSSLVVAETVKTNLNQSFLLTWYKYRDTWAQAMHNILKEPPHGLSFLHKRGEQECRLWDPFRQDVMKKVTMEWHGGLYNLPTIIKTKTTEYLQDCPQCPKRAAKWAERAEDTHRKCTESFI